MHTVIKVIGRLILLMAQWLEMVAGKITHWAHVGAWPSYLRLIRDNWLFEITPAESKSMRDAWYLFSNAYMSTYWATGKVQVEALLSYNSKHFHNPFESQVPCLIYQSMYSIQCPGNRSFSNQVVEWTPSQIALSWTDSHWLTNCWKLASPLKEGRYFLLTTELKRQNLIDFDKIEQQVLATNNGKRTTLDRTIKVHLRYIHCTS